MNIPNCYLCRTDQCSFHPVRGTPTQEFIRSEQVRAQAQYEALVSDLTACSERESDPGPARIRITLRWPQHGR